MNREKFKVFGFYALAALLILRLVIVPWQNNIKEKKALLKEYQETYRMKLEAYDRFMQGEKTKGVKRNVPEDAILKSAYDRNTPFVDIQTEVVKEISDKAEKNGLMVQNFEFQDVVPLKHISEAPVIIRLKGEQKGVVALLKEIEKGQKKLLIRRFEDGRGGQDFFCSMTVYAYRIGTE
jgi:Tfp pilus assembly protein PilO